MGRRSAKDLLARITLLEATFMHWIVKSKTAIKEDDPSSRANLLTGMHYPNDFLTYMMWSIRFNLIVACRIKDITQNTYNPVTYARQNGLDEELHEYQYELGKISTLSMVMSLILRLKSEHHTPPMIVALSLIAYKLGVPRKFWRILTSCKILMSYTWTESFVQQLAGQPFPKKFDEATRVALACFDNCGYYQKLQYFRQACKNLFLDTVNWYYVPLPRRLDVQCQVAFTGRPNISRFFTPYVEDHSALLNFCSKYAAFRLSQGENLMEYPPRGNCTPTFFIIKFPICDLSTASYEDILLMLYLIKEDMYASNPQLKFIFIVGDEQTYDRMIKIKMRERHEFNWLIPLPGEFHLCGHHLHCAFRLWWPSILQSCQAFLGNDKVEQDWTMTKFNQHEDFFMVVVCGISDWFEHVFGDGCWDRPTALYAMLEGNFTSELLYQFMYEDGLPYMTLRNLLRMAPSLGRRGIIDQFYFYLCQRFRTVNKFLYSMLCVHAQYMKHALHPDLWNVFCHCYAGNLSGNDGRWMALDALMEKINKMAKTMMRGKVTYERIVKVVPTINVLQPVENAYANALIPADGRYDYLGAPSFATDIWMIRQMLCTQHADDFYQATAASDNNVLTGRSRDRQVCPRDKVIRATHDWQEYVDGKIDRLGF